MTDITVSSVDYTISVNSTTETITITSGLQGPPGQGVPSGGTTGQFLRKATDTDFDTEWTSSTSTVAWGGVTGTLSDQTDLQAAIDSVRDDAIAFAIVLG